MDSTDAVSSISPARAREFWADTFRLLDLSAAQRDNDALALAIQIAERFPEQPAESSFLLACAYNRAGDEEQALRTLETALDRGNCWHDSLLLWSPSLKPLRELPRFHGILARSKAIMDDLEAHTRVSVTVFAPKAGPTATAPPLFLPLHGGADIPGEHDRYWAAAADFGLVVAVARSSQRRSSDTFWWGGPPEPFDRDRSERDVKAAYEEVSGTFAFDVTRVVLGGFSQGAVLAVTLALQNRPSPVRGLACVGPGIEDLEPLLPLMEPAAARGLRAWILAGERERGLELITRLARELTLRGVPCELDVVPGLGHEFPEDFGTRLQSGLSFLLD
jgi:acetyl esterase/lipase